MNNSTLLLLLDRLDKKEWRDFRQFLCSPYFNQRKDVLQLFDIIEESRLLKIIDLDKRKAFQKIFPEENYQDAKIRHLMSYLLKLLKSFLVQQQIETDEVHQNIKLCHVLRKKGMNKMFEKEWKTTQNLQGKQLLRNTHFYYNNYQLNLERSEHLHQSQRRGEMNLQEMTDELTTFYMADLLRQACSVLAHQSMDSQIYELKLLPAVVQLVEQGWLLDIPAVAIYFHSYRALKDSKNEHDFYRLPILIKENWEQFPKAEIRDILVLAINYCIKRLNSGDKEFIREAFELYRFGLEKEIFIDNKILSLYTYKNILKLGLALKEYDWVESYLENYKKYLAPEQRENNYSHNLAIFYFSKKDYTKAMNLLQQVEFKDRLHQLGARRMLLLMYYELGEFDALESLLDSFQTYIRRQKDLGYHRENFLNLIRFIRKMLRVNLDIRVNREKLIEELEQTKSIIERAWLLEQLQA